MKKNRKKNHPSKLIFALFILLLSVASVFVLTYFLVTTRYFISLTWAGLCNGINAQKECNDRGCVATGYRCKWIAGSGCKKYQDSSCKVPGSGGGSGETDSCKDTCPKSSCDDSAKERAENNARCTKVPIKTATYCSDFRRPYCCPIGKVWTHSDKTCCLPSQVVWFWNENYDVSYDPPLASWDTACGCPEGKVCAY